VAYATVQLVQGLVGDVVAGSFDANSSPTLVTVQAIIESIDARINMELKRRGYTAPVTDSDEDPYNYLVYIASCGAAARVLSTRPAETYEDPDAQGAGGNRRTMLDREFQSGLKRIRDYELVTDGDAAPVSDLRWVGAGHDRLFGLDRFEFAGSPLG